MQPKREEESEMSMEEILSSIRKYVIDEKKGEKSSIDAGLPPHNPLTEIYDEDEVIELTDPIEEPKKSKSSTSQEPNPPEKKAAKPSSTTSPTAKVPEKNEMEAHASAQYPFQVQATAPTPSQREQPITQEPLTSSQTFSASAQALARLLEATRPSAQNSAMSGTTVEQLIVEVTRPLIKDWLDKNLANIVESIVAREIDRLTHTLSAKSGA